MVVFFTALGIFVFFGMASVALQHNPHWANRVGAIGAVLGSIAGLVAAIHCLGWMDCAFNTPWLVPGGAFHLSITPLSAFFLLPLFVLGGLAAVYGTEYLLPPHAENRNAHKIGAAWFFYNVLMASMALVFTAQNAVLFLVAWEAMALSSFFLVTYDDDKKDVRSAGWTYLVATHVGTAFLFAFFALMGRQAGSFEFSAFTEHSAPAGAGLLFVLAVIGFGTKAGFMPLHVWLPEAHPAAPSHVSALMSGVMIKTGIYGMLMTISWLG
ncbi:TPA: oxidoreductase, partial [Candidatus Sumerlaeota bacterium]|nr:oxidoreductase [Candidatus Sumerlaeota bacterium]